MRRIVVYGLIIVLIGSLTIQAQKPVLKLLGQKSLPAAPEMLIDSSMSPDSLSFELPADSIIRTDLLKPSIDDIFKDTEL